MKTVGEKIRMRRNELGWSLQELADRMGYANKSTVSRIEAGTIDVSQSKLAEFAKVMRTSIAFLMDWEQVQQDNSILVDLTLRMRTDSEFMALVQNLNELNPEQLASVMQIVGVLLKQK